MILPRYRPIMSETPFTHLKLPVDISPAVRSELNGKRVYIVDGDASNPLYSVTTVLGEREKEWVENWRREVGEEYAKKVSTNASNIGTCIHSLCESYLSNIDINDQVRNNTILYHRFKKLTATLNKIDNIYCLETPLYSKRLKLAGTVDCIAEYDGTLSVIDFKTSNKPKQFEEIPHYFAQATAYSIMFYEMYGIKIKQLVIIISIDSDDTIVYVSNIGKHIDYLIDSIKIFNKTLEDKNGN